MGFPVFLPLDVYHHAINGRRAIIDYPNEGQLRDLRDYSILRERERMDSLRNRADDQVELVVMQRVTPPADNPHAIPLRTRRQGRPESPDFFSAESQPALQREERAISNDEADNNLMRESLVETRNHEDTDEEVGCDLTPESSAGIFDD